MQAHKLQEAEEDIQKGQQIHPADGMGWVMLARVLELDNHIEAGGEACSQGAIHDPSSWKQIFARLRLTEVIGNPLALGVQRDRQIAFCN
jgi:predicted Zn-dependent protease